MRAPSFRGHALLRNTPSASLPTQAFLLMAFSIAIVSIALIWHQGESIKKQVLEERLAAIYRQASIVRAHIGSAGIGADRAAVAAYLQPGMDEMMAELGAIQTVITDETGLIIATSDEEKIGQMEGAEEVRLVLLGEFEFMMRPEIGEGEVDFAFTIPLAFPAFRGTLHVEEDIRELYAAVADATRESALPAVLMLLIVAPLVALVTRRILKQTQQSEQERAWQGRFQSLVQSATDVTLIVDEGGSIQYATPSLERVLGRTPADVHHVPVPDLIHPADLGAAQTALAGATEARGRVTRSEYRMLHGDGRWVFVEVHSVDLRDDPAIRGTVLTIRDSSIRRALEAQLTHQALHDPLTGLANSRPVQ